MAEVLVVTITESRPARVTRLQLVKIEDIRGAKVQNIEGEEIGSIRDYVLDLNSGAILYAALAYGGVLGVGEKLFAIPWEALIPEPGQGVFYADIPKERLEALPGFDWDAWPIAGDWSLIGSFRPSAATQPVSRPLQMEVRAPVRTEEEIAAEAVPIQPITPIEPVSAPQTARSREEVVILVEPRTVPLPAEGASRAFPSAEMPPETRFAEEPLATPAKFMAPAAERYGEAAHTHLSAAALQQYLKGVDYPSDKQGLIAKAREHGASTEALEALQRFEEREYRSAIDVSQEFGRIK